MLPSFITDPKPDIYHDGSYLVLDFETTNIDKGDAYNEDNHVVLAYWMVVSPRHGTRYRYCFGSEIHQERLRKDIEEVDFIVCQNSKFELQWLKRCGVDLRKVVHYDTMIAQYVIQGNRKSSLDLSSIGKRYGLGSKSSYIDKMIKAGVCPSTLPREPLKRYCRRDVLLTHDVFLAQLQYIRDNHPPLLPIVYARCLLTPVLADIEGNGVTLDKEKVFEVREEYESKLAEIDEQLYELNPDLNWNSAKQKAEYLYDVLKFEEAKDWRGEPIRTPSGARKTDSETISSLVARTEDQRQIVTLIQQRNKYHSALSKYLNFFYGICKEHGGVFRGVFNQCVTSTHRLSSSGRRIAFDCLDGKEAGAQFQNLPRDFKHLFTASAPDRVIGEGDGSQLEFRVAGHLGRDEQVFYDITHEVDIHAFTAEELTNAGEPTNRQDAKASTFRPLYGGSSGTPAIQEYCRAFRDKYSSLSEVQAGWAREAAANKRLVTEWGMVYYFPFVRVGKDGYIHGSTQIYNFPIQAFATAEIIPLALVCFWHRIAETDIKIVNTVHDSIIVDMPPHLVDRFSQYMALSMMDDVYHLLKTLYNVDLTVPLGVGIKVGSHWTVADKSLATGVINGLEAAGYEATNEDDVEFKADFYKKVLDK